MISADLLRFPHTSQQSSKIDFLDGNLLGNILWLEIPVDSLLVGVCGVVVPSCGVCLKQHGRASVRKFFQFQ